MSTSKVLHRAGAAIAAASSASAAHQLGAPTLRLPVAAAAGAVCGSACAMGCTLAPPRRMLHVIAPQTAWLSQRSSLSHTATAAASLASSARAQPPKHPSGQQSQEAAPPQPAEPPADEDDEYGEMAADGLLHVFDHFELESGKRLQQVPVMYKTYGQLSPGRDNALVVCHALTGNASLDSWWGTLLGPGKPFDTDRYFVICANILGSCYGTCGPTTINPETGRRYGSHFPNVTVRDSVRLHARLLREVVGVKQVAAVVGGSLGGMQALEWAFEGPDFVRKYVAMACGADHTPWQIAFGETQRQAIYADSKWLGGDYDPTDPPVAGLSVARQFAMISYRTADAYIQKFGRERVPGVPNGVFQVESYLRYQGHKFFKRFDAASYVAITRMMDTHDVGRGRGGVATALKRLTQPGCVIGVDSDVLYPLSDQQRLHRMLPNAEMHVIKSMHGHDGFLLEQQDIEGIVTRFLRK